MSISQGDMSFRSDVTRKDIHNIICPLVYVHLTGKYII